MFIYGIKEDELRELVSALSPEELEELLLLFERKAD